MRLTSLLILLLFALAAYGQSQERVAIIQTLDNNDSISFNDLTYLTDKLRETAVKVLPRERFGVMTTESIVAFLGSQERAIKICRESSCLAELGRMVSADYVAQGHIGRFSNNLTIKVELYSVKTGNLMDSFTGHSKDIYGFLALIDEKAPLMFKNMFATTTPPPTPAPVTPPKRYSPPPPPEPKYVSPVEPKPVVPIVKKNKTEEYDERLERVKTLIKNGVEKNKEEIQKESSDLWSNDREILYMDNEKKAAGWWTLLNLDPSFGLGSFIQGDTWTGLALSSSEILGMGLIGAGGESNSKVVMGLGIGIFATSYISGLIAPYRHQKKYNETLKEALNINKDQRVHIQELIDIGVEKNKVEIQKLSFSLSPDEKGLLWKNNEKKWAGVLAVVNVYPVLALGSYLQGNIAFGVTQSALQIGGFVAAEKSNKTLGQVMVASGVAIGLVAPFVYQSRYNKTLKDALNIDDNYDNYYDNFSLSIDPLIIPKDGAPAVGLAFNLRY